jgi:hypothetical protein
MYLSDGIRAVAMAAPDAVLDRPLYDLTLKFIRHGRLPVERKGRNYSMDEKDLPLLARLLGLTKREPVEPDRAA